MEFCSRYKIHINHLNLLFELGCILEHYYLEQECFASGFEDYRKIIGMLEGGCSAGILPSTLLYQTYHSMVLQSIVPELLIEDLLPILLS